ncbi:MAG: hypothetical protein ACE5GE_02290 [Phycisphaerae bacterium]
MVYASRDDSGRLVARKVFGAQGLTKLVQYAFLGAPNPYQWSQDAIACAVLRRRILAELVEFWFGSKLRVSRAFGHCWNREHRAFEMHCELIDGRHVGLCHPFTPPGECELSDARHRVMMPLQARLIESGFDGLVWQAGRGNPVALNNFMREGSDGTGQSRWAWIDLESGVPALIPLNPLDLILFYLPKSVHHRGPLFDDVDVDKLRGYVTGQAEALDERLGGGRTVRLLADIEDLERHQTAWKSLPRFRQSIAYRRAIGSITREEAQWYERHAIQWYGREVGRAGRALPGRVMGWVAAAVTSLARIRVGRIFHGCWKALCSQQYRTQLARDYVSARIARWQDRRQLSDRQATVLREHLRSEEASTYLTDFGVHLAIKPLVKTMEWWIMPALWMAGTIDEVFLGVFLIAAGPCVRTLYTAGRLIQNTFTGRDRPWVALFIGAIPVVGNLAYPLQIVATGAQAQASAARFIVYDTLSRLGRWLPIWGGADTLTEHLLNRVPDRVMRFFRRLSDRRGADTVRPTTERVPDAMPMTFEGQPSLSDAAS